MTTTHIRAKGSDTTTEVVLRPPTLDDGAALWRMTRDSQVLDVNSPYAYLLWCDRFAQSSVVAEVDGEVAGFIMGFHPPEDPEVLFVWQVAVGGDRRGLGLGSRMLDELVDRTRSTAVQATVTPSNTASQRLFRALARRRGCECREEPHILAEHFPTPDHEPENLFHIAPIEH